MGTKVDYSRTAKRADKMISRYGQPVPALLRRAGVDRKCTAVMIDYKWNEKSVRAEGARRFLVSTIDPETGLTIVPPDFEQDKLVFNGEIHNIVSPDEGLRPGGTTIYHDLEAVYDTRDV